MKIDIKVNNHRFSFEEDIIEVFIPEILEVKTIDDWYNLDKKEKRIIANRIFNATLIHYCQHIDPGVPPTGTIRATVKEDYYDWDCEDFRKYWAYHLCVREDWYTHKIAYKVFDCSKPYWKAESYKW